MCEGISDSFFSLFDTWFSNFGAKEIVLWRIHKGVNVISWFHDSWEIVEENFRWPFNCTSSNPLCAHKVFDKMSKWDSPALDNVFVRSAWLDIWVKPTNCLTKCHIEKFMCCFCTYFFTRNAHYFLSDLPPIVWQNATEIRNSFSFFMYCGRIIRTLVQQRPMFCYDELVNDQMNIHLYSIFFSFYTSK